MSRGFASGVRRLLAAVGMVAVAAMPLGAIAKVRDHDADCVCGSCVADADGGLLGNYLADDCPCDGDCVCGLLVTAAGGCTSGDEMLWVRADYVLWDRDGVDLPALVTASPAGTPEAIQGVVGLGTTTILAGDETVSDDLRSGWAIEAGLWLDACTGWALAADYFYGGRDGYGFVVGPGDGRIIARPFFNTQTNMEDAIVFDSPGAFLGSVGVSAFDDFQGAGAWMEKCVWRRGNACTSAGGSRISLLGGYRYYHHDSLVFIRGEDIVIANPDPMMFPVGQVHVGFDKFAGGNEFHGFELGFEGRIQRCRWWCEGLAAFAFGGSRRVVFVEGTTIVAPPAFPAVASQGALLTSGITNIGRYVDKDGQIVPRFRLEAGWQWTERIGLHVGYNLIVWDIVQAADHLPPGRRVDPRNIPEIIMPGGAEPIFPGIRETTLVAHGLELGLELNF
jgi:hypothetical protein